VASQENATVELTASIRPPCAARAPETGDRSVATGEHPVEVVRNRLVVPADHDEPAMRSPLDGEDAQCGRHRIREERSPARGKTPRGEG
jgi:hypothetical protein